MDQLDRELLQRLEDRVESMNDKLDKVRTEDIPGIRIYVAGELATLREKSRLWSAAAGILGALAAVLIALAFK